MAGLVLYGNGDLWVGWVLTGGDDHGDSTPGRPQWWLVDDASVTRARDIDEQTSHALPLCDDPCLAGLMPCFLCLELLH